jgi:hypothetical protein
VLKVLGNVDREGTLYNVTCKNNRSVGVHVVVRTVIINEDLNLYDLLLITKDGGVESAVVVNMLNANFALVANAVLIFISVLAFFISAAARNERKEKCEGNKD